MHSVRFSEEEEALMENIEDEIDSEMARKACSDYKADPVTYSFEDIKKRYGLRWDVQSDLRGMRSTIWKKLTLCDTVLDFQASCGN